MHSVQILHCKYDISSEVFSQIAFLVRLAFNSKTVFGIKVQKNHKVITDNSLKMANTER